MTVAKSNPVLLITAFVGLSLAVVAGVLWWTASSEPRPAPPAKQKVEPEAQPIGPVPVQANPGQPPAPPRDIPGIKMIYPEPDGAMPALNGVQQQVALSWAADKPYARITGKTTDVNGFEWYVHEDGTTTTTYYIWRKDLGRYDAQSIVRHPAALAPMVPEEVPGHKEPPKGPPR